MPRRKMARSKRGGSNDRRAEEMTPNLLFTYLCGKMAPFLVLLLLGLLGVAEERSPPVAGGLHPVPTDDPGVVNASRVAEQHYNHESNDLFYTAVSNVTSANTQVVAGIMYHLTLELRTTICRKAEADLQNCPFHEDPQHAKLMTCRFKVWDRPWIGPMEVNESHCMGVEE